MATILSAKSGAWSDPTTWTGGAVPTGTDTAKVQHQVTLDVNIGVGGIDPASVGTIIATSGPVAFRLAVGSPNLVCTVRGIST